MQAEILSTGDEIRSGALADANASHIARNLEDAGIAVLRHHCVGDDMEQLVMVLKEIAPRSDIGIVTGGLGPTADDITAEAAARAAGVAMAINDTALAGIESFFRKRQRPLTPSNRKPAIMPHGASVIANPSGTAPGFALNIDRCRFFFLPGVPAEMKRMLTETVLEAIAAGQGGKRDYILVSTLSSFGLPESVVDEKLAGLTQRFPEIRLGLRAVFPEIHIKLYARGKARQKLSEQLTQVSDDVVSRLDHRVFSTQGETMQAVVGRLLRQQGATVAVAESCTGGLISHLLTDVSGSSDYFLFSGVTYSNAAKIRVLGVSPDILDRHGAVHEKTAQAMAEGARNVSGATYGIATSGIAGPTGAVPGKPVGTLCVGLARPDGSHGKRYQFPFDDRAMNKQVFAITALNRLRLALLGVV
jgi:nicotinamide-nucleotide amidase